MRQGRVRVAQFTGKALSGRRELLQGKRASEERFESGMKGDGYGDHSD